MSQIREILREAEKVEQCAKSPRIIQRVKQVEEFEELPAEINEHRAIQMAEFDETTAGICQGFENPRNAYPEMLAQSVTDRI